MFCPNTIKKTMLKDKNIALDKGLLDEIYFTLLLK